MVLFTVDAVPPYLSIFGLENRTYYSSDIEIEYTVSEVSNVTCSLDGNENFTISQNTMFSNLTIGKHNATFLAVDRAGNTDSKTIYFTIAEPFPVIPVAAGSTISISTFAAGLLVYFKKRKQAG